MQNYKNHTRFYTPHHFVFFPVVGFLLAIAIYQAFSGENQLLWIFIAALVFMVGWLSFMLRQHYALIGQNRIIVLEMRFRYYVLTKERFEPIEDQLSFGKIAALRFAPDDELPALVKKAVAEGLSADQIKRSIVNWLPDLKRV
ncbi:hypothetical protein ACVWYN_003025 [Pedobacter sp. UYP24]